MTSGPRRRRLRTPTIAVADESARGLVCRALGDHGVPRSWTVLQLVGLQHRNVVRIAEDENLDLIELARILRIDPGELLSRRYPALPNRRRGFFGIDLPSSAIEDRRRRFSPASLALSPHIRAAWELRGLPFCAVGWDLLLDTCRCGVAQRFVRLNRVHRCDDCGRPLSTLPSTSVPEGLRSDLALVSSIVSPLPAVRRAATARLPEAIGHRDPGTIFEAIMLIRQAVAGSRAGALDDLSALASACRAVLDWPVGIRSLEAGPGTLRAVWNRAIRTYLALSTGNGSGDPGLPVPVGEHRASVASARSRIHVRNGLIGLHPANRMTGLAPSTLLSARKAGLLGSHERSFGTRILPAFDVDELKALAASMRNRISAAAIGVRLGCGSWAVAEIGASGRLGERAVEIGGNDVCYTPAGLEGFERALVDAAGDLGAETVPLHRAMLDVHGRTKPWGAFAAAILDGRVPFELDASDKPLFRRIRVRPDAFADAMLLSRAVIPGQRIVKQEALELLNADYNSDVLSGMRGEGTNPVLFDVNDVLALARRAISSTELGWRRRKSTSRAHVMLSRLGVERLATDFWRRDQIEALLASDRL